MSCSFFSNKSCEYFPCHETDDPDSFNCMFCYCPLYTYKNCEGVYVYTKKGVKDCSGCLKPHYDYDGILERLKDINGENGQGAVLSDGNDDRVSSS